MKRHLSIGFILSAITMILVLVLVSVFALLAQDAHRQYRQAKHVLNVTKLARAMISARSDMRSESGTMSMVLSRDRPSGAVAAAALQAIHKKTLAGLTQTISDLKHSPYAGSPSLARVEDLATRYDLISAEVLVSIRRPAAERRRGLFKERLDISSALVRAINRQSEIITYDIARLDPFIDRMLDVSDTVWRLRADAGADRLVVSNWLFGRIAVSINEHLTLARGEGVMEAHFATLQAQADMPTFPSQLKKVMTDVRTGLDRDYFPIRQQLVQRRLTGQRIGTTDEQWLAFSVPQINRLVDISWTALNLARDRAEEMVDVAGRNLVLYLIAMALCLVLAVSVFGFVLLRVIRPLRRITDMMHSVGDGELKGGEIPFENRTDEIGQFACALRVFRDSALERQRLASEALENRVAKESAEASSKIKSEFLASMSHELRTPLNAILGFSEILAAQLYGPLGHKKYVEYAEDVHKSGAHLLELINDVLDLSKIDAGKVELRETIFSVDELVDDAVLLVGGKAKDHASLEVCVPVGLQILADKRLTKQILINLLSNAIKFTPKGGTITVGARRGRGQELEIYVADTGIGMDAAQLEKAFSPYGQINSQIAQVHQGTGLGLPIAQSMARLQGGDVIAQSTPAHGTRMTLILPRTRIVEPADSPQLVA
jgi:signal transduction histidine kinase